MHLRRWVCETNKRARITEYCQVAANCLQKRAPVVSTLGVFLLFYWFKLAFLELQFIGKLLSIVRGFIHYGNCFKNQTEQNKDRSLLVPPVPFASV